MVLFEKFLEVISPLPIANRCMPAYRCWRHTSWKRNGSNR